MKLATFTAGDSRHRLGAVVDDGETIVDLQAAVQFLSGRPDASFASLQALIEGGDDALGRAYDVLDTAPGRARIRRADVRLQAPLQPPPQIRDCACFEEHFINAFREARKVRAALFDDPDAAMREMEERQILFMPKEFYERPLYYKANRFAVIGTDDDVIWPGYCNTLDFELEFGCYIKKPAKNVSVTGARDFIFGYTIFNDMSARDEQTLEMPGNLGPGKGKDFDTGNPMGPWLVTADELTDPYALKMEARVNGEIWGGGTSASMYWKFEDLIAHISRDETLYPGEFLGSGTVGTGAGIEQMRFLKPGDVVELYVEGIGTLKNRVVRPG
ncbi:fumarylacetoacetate hydrolase family protein [Chachezhania sediminis]|uniref:fumarylacetoacetate hydrolase family protein n=1 Tax=Chachezhania sediminis TaxID=2599291 RepID=UPI00131AACBF|nr:fumarylacetoacetate hydrolase family protein [Chachezhania sediminis]